MEIAEVGEQVWRDAVDLVVEVLGPMGLAELRPELVTDVVVLRWSEGAGRFAAGHVHVHARVEAAVAPGDRALPVDELG